MDINDQGRAERAAAMQEILEIWQREMTTELDQEQRTQMLTSDVIRKLSGRLRTDGREKVGGALVQARISNPDALTPERWLQTHDQLHRPSPAAPRRRGICDEEIPLRRDGNTAPPSGGIGHAGLG
jgi:hypothetical protein